MKMFVDTSYLLSHPCGISVYTMNLLNALDQADFQAEYHTGLISLNLSSHTEIERRAIALCPNVQLNCRHVYFPHQLIGKIPAFLGKRLLFHPEEYDLMLYPGGVIPRWAENVSLENTVLTVHDAYVFHDGPQKNPSIEYVRLHLKEQVRNCRAVITVSRFSQREIARYCEVPESRITVIPNAVLKPETDHWQRSSVLRRNGLDRYFFSVGALYSSKNMPGLIEAFYLYKKSGKYQGEKLVIAGKRRPGEDDETYRRLQEVGDILFLDNPCTEDIWKLYSEALGYFIVSKVEGFGIPLLEAMTQGCPSCCSRGTALEEVGRDAVLKVDPEDPEEIASAFAAFSEGKKAFSAMTEKAEKIAAEYTLRTIAEKHIALFQSLCGKR